MGEDLGFTITRETLIREGFKTKEAEALILILREGRKTFENHECPVVGYDIGLRTNQEGTILGVSCEFYRQEKDGKPHQCKAGEGSIKPCNYGPMIGK